MYPLVLLGSTNLISKSLLRLYWVLYGAIWLVTITRALQSKAQLRKGGRYVELISLSRAKGATRQPEKTQTFIYPSHFPSYT